jgi:hypothetical protein
MLIKILLKRMKKKKREAKIKKQSGNLKIDNFFLILLS